MRAVVKKGPLCEHVFTGAHHATANDIGKFACGIIDMFCPAQAADGDGTARPVSSSLAFAAAKIISARHLYVLKRAPAALAQSAAS